MSSSVGSYSEHHGCLYCTGHLKTEVCGVRGGTEIKEGKEESDLTVCPGQLTNFVSIINLFVGTWIVCSPIIF